MVSLESLQTSYNFSRIFRAQASEQPSFQHLSWDDASGFCMRTSLASPSIATVNHILD